MLDLGVVRPGSTIRIPFSTFDKDDGSAITMTNFAAADILIYKDGSTTERASTSGFTATTDFDSKTGKQLIVIDLSDNTTADFYAAGSEYLVAIDAVTVDAVTVGGWVARFRIGYEGALLDTTLATLSSQTSFTLTAGPADDNALVGCIALIHDAASAVQRAIGVVSAYTGSTKTVKLAADPGIFTMAAKDNISFFVPANTRFVGGTVQTARDIGASVLLSSGTGTGQLDFTSGVVKSNVTQFGGTNGTFSGGRPEVNTSHIAGSAVSASSAQIGVNLVNIAGAAVSTSSAQLGVNVVNFGGSAGTFASGRPEVNTTHAAGTAWGSGAITSGAFAAGAITASAIAADAIGASELATDAVTEIAAAVWNSAMASYQTAGTMGLAVNELDTIYTNAYDGITARILANTTHINGTLASTILTTPVSAIKAKTDSLTFTVANVVDANTTQWKGSTAPAMTGDAYARLGAPAGASVSADIAATKAKTDLIGTTSILATDSITAAAISAAAANKIADHARRRTQANVEASSDGDTLNKNSLYGFIQQAQKSSASGTTLTIYKTDGTTTLGTITLTPTAGADPITGVS